MAEKSPVEDASPLDEDVSSLLDEIQSASPFRAEELARKIAASPEFDLGESFVQQIEGLVTQERELQRMVEGAVREQERVTHAILFPALLPHIEMEERQSLDWGEKFLALAPEAERLAAQQKDLERLLEATAEVQKRFKSEFERLVEVEVEAQKQLGEQLAAQLSKFESLVEAFAENREKLGPPVQRLLENARGEPESWEKPVAANQPRPRQPVPQEDVDSMVMVSLRKLIRGVEDRTEGAGDDE